MRCQITLLYIWYPKIRFSWMQCLWGLCRRLLMRTRLFSCLFICLFYHPVIYSLKRPQVIETRVFPGIGCALTTATTQGKIHFMPYPNFNWLFLNWSAWSSTVVTADETHSNLISLPHHHRKSYHKNREAWASVQKIRNQGIGPFLRALKERQVQNWPGKHLLPNFPMQMKVSPFVFTNHWQSMNIYSFL